MSEQDLPARFAKYDGDHITLTRIALTVEQLRDFAFLCGSGEAQGPALPVVRSNYGDRCWELDAMDPNDLRDCVEQEILWLIEPVAWQRCEVVNKAEQESLRNVLAQWGQE